ncbi:MAG: Phenylalanine-tRNA ligase [Candidatus Saccharibacteria bacterium]|nr:Phenylalanine-tRNA ligase [Candidatus Saccharibacteria bacterium]
MFMLSVYVISLYGNCFLCIKLKGLLYYSSDMSYQNTLIDQTAELLKNRLQELSVKQDIFKAVELRALYDQLRILPPEEKASFGQEVNALRQELTALVQATQVDAASLPPIDVTAPFASNTAVADRPHLLPTELGSVHPLMTEIATIVDIFGRMGFAAVESRQIDDDHHMFNTLNFPEGHPARDDFDTFTTEQTDKNGKSLIAPAHTSIMQHRILKAGKAQLEAGTPIASVMPGRVFRNEDLDATHEHTFYQLEGVYVSTGVNAGMLMATLQTFLNSYFGQELKTKTQPFYFPFTEPSFEFAIERPAVLRKDDSEEQQWLELVGCGMIHPNVLRHAGIDPEVYTGFAWGFGIERLVLMKYGIEDIRHFESAKLDFLRQFS